MIYLTVSVEHYWLAASVLFFALEVFGFPGIGFFFVGLGALATGVLLSFEFIGQTEIVMQIAVFLIVTICSGIVLWKPIQKMFSASGAASGYNDLIGATAAVAGELRRGAEGNVHWSGTTMKAELSPDSPVDALTNGAYVTIVGVVGAKLIVMPKS